MRFAQVQDVVSMNLDVGTTHYIVFYTIFQVPPARLHRRPRQNLSGFLTG
jgi:hypothetical protein